MNQTTTSEHKKEIGELLKEIANLQAKKHPLLRDGIFPSTREHRFLPYHRIDENIFLSAAICFLLQRFRPLLTTAQQRLADDICQKVTACYPYYRKNTERETYNFFEHKPNAHFPHGILAHRLQFLRPADDVDDTSLIYLTSKKNERQVAWLKNKLPQHANISSGKQIGHTFPHYSHLQAYSTFFGEKMYIEFDCCVLSNLLMLLLNSEQPLNQHDLDSLKYITSVIEKEEHISSPFVVAPSYPRSSHILYHTSRLVHVTHRPEVFPLRKALVKSVRKELENPPRNEMDRLLLSISAKRLNIPIPPTIAGFKKSQIIKEDFFYVSLWSLSSSPKFRKLDKLAFFQVRFRCRAFNLALLMENHLLSAGNH
ncbi:hypothetical protein R9C00_14930 [Flammeovirgaceae bacterium SG7u.111]|nr:hypothetical protein [Flammeovirgaceae bacterium SG7u.132]WPO32995.1 hypothetical protein R9C00_14930 [Flammeovirgaceae bacterium SG7u.111]